MVHYNTYLQTTCKHVNLTRTHPITVHHVPALRPHKSLLIVWESQRREQREHWPTLKAQRSSILLVLVFICDCGSARPDGKRESRTTTCWRYTAELPSPSQSWGWGEWWEMFIPKSSLVKLEANKITTGMMNELFFPGLQTANSWMHHQALFIYTA